MGELEDRINSILSDPEQMEQIAGLAKTLMGGADSTAQSQPIQAPPPFDPSLLGKLGTLLGSGGVSRDEALLEAMLPYLSERRRGKMDKAIRLAKIARIARMAIDGMEGVGDDKPL